MRIAVVVALGLLLAATLGATWSPVQGQQAKSPEDLLLTQEEIEAVLGEEGVKRATQTTWRIVIVDGKLVRGELAIAYYSLPSSLISLTLGVEVWPLKAAAKASYAARLSSSRWKEIWEATDTITCGYFEDYIDEGTACVFHIANVVAWTWWYSQSLEEPLKVLEAVYLKVLEAVYLKAESAVSMLNPGLALQNALLTIDELRQITGEKEWYLSVPPQPLFEEPEGADTAAVIFRRNNELLLIVLYRFGTHEAAREFFPEIGDWVENQEFSKQLKEAVGAEQAAGGIKYDGGEQHRFWRWQLEEWVVHFQLNTLTSQLITEEIMIKLAIHQQGKLQDGDQ